MNSIVNFIIVLFKSNRKHINSLKIIIGKQRVVEINNQKINQGYSTGVNAGMKQLLKKNCEWFVLLNQDIQIRRGATEVFCKMLNKNPIGIVGLFAGRLDIRRWTTILPSNKVDYISGACIAIHRKVIEKIGIFYEPYFMYYEDADYCVRAKKAGFPLIRVPVKGITHDDNPTLGKGSFLHEYYLARNHLLFVERLAPLGVKCHEYLRLPKTLAEHVLHKNTGALEGIKDYFMRRFGEKKV